MLAKQRRLVRKKDFIKIFKQGEAFYTKLLGIKILANQLNFNRFGIIVSAKVSKKSTERNKLKRQVRQILRQLDSKLTPGFDMVVMVLPGLLKQDYIAIKKELEKILARQKLVK